MWCGMSAFTVPGCSTVLHEMVDTVVADAGLFASGESKTGCSGVISTCSMACSKLTDACGVIGDGGRGNGMWYSWDR